MTDSFSIRAVLESAADLYVDHGRFASFSALSEATGVSEEQLHDEFGTVDAVVTRYYADLADRCKETLEALDPPTAEERAGAFTFIMLDLLEERPEFVRATFRSYAAGWGSAFRSALGDVVGTVLDSPEVPAVNELVLTTLPARLTTVDTFLRLLNTWLDDDSENRQRATALIDKVVRFYAGLATSPTASRGVDVARYAAEAGYLPQIPFVSDWLFGGASEKQAEAANDEQ